MKQYWQGPFFAGIVFAKYDVIVRLKKMFCNLPFKAVFGLLVAFVVIWCRCFVVGSEVDLVYAPIFAVSLSVFFDSIKPLKFVFNLIGKHSTNMWLVHSFYCYYFLEITKLVYITSNVWIDLGILVVMSFFTSVLLELFYMYLFKGMSYIHSKFIKKQTDEIKFEQKSEEIEKSYV